MTGKRTTVKFERDSAFGYYVWLDGRIIGHVAGSGRRWSATQGEFDLGEHRSRREAVAAVIGIDRT